MFTRPILIYRSSSSPTLSRSLQFLFLLHTCTALFTIVNALQQNDNEAIIQLSVDSIHVVKPSDTRFTNIEDNLSDTEEKDLLLALLSSFDDETRVAKLTPIDKTNEEFSPRDLSSINNCSSSTIVADKPPPASSLIRFIPSSLQFDEQSIAIPCMQTVMIINDHFEPLELYSLSGTTVQFYSSFFTQKILPAHGGNTTIHVYFLPRTLGTTKSTFTIQTSHGTFQYYVHGIGKVNPFRLRPLIGATIPLNSSFEYSIHFYNPYNYSIDIEEMYTSDENLIIDASPDSTNERWHFEPYQSKVIAKIHYFSWLLDRLHAFYCIKTTANDTIIVPVEIRVENDLSLYSNVDILEFTPDNLVRSTEEDIVIPIYVINDGMDPVTITNIRLPTEHINYLTVHYENVPVSPDVHRWHQVAELTLHPSLIPKDITSIYGSVQIETHPSIDDPVTLEIPYQATILHGSLDYDHQSTYFYISSSSSSKEKTEECRMIEFFNRFNVPITIFNISTDQSDLLSLYLKISFFSPYVHLAPGQSASPLCVTVIPQPLSLVTFMNFKARLTLHTNLSSFHIPIYLYSGLLSINLVTDHTNGGIKRSDTNLLEFFIASIPVHSSRTVKFVLINTNPIDLPIEKISVTFAHTTIQLFEMQLLNGTAISALSNGSFEGDSIASLILPARHQAVFALTIQATSEASSYDETLTFRTPYETLKMNLKYRVISGSINLNNEVPLHIDVFPNLVGTIDLFLHNGLTKPTEITRIEFPLYGKCFSFTWNTTTSGRLLVEPQQSHHVGKLSFDMIPLCDTLQIPCESTCYCGLNNYPEFKQTWEEHVSALDTYELDHVLVSKFQTLWNEWTTFVRNQRIESNIWLVTDQANVSWPITIGFVWPSVLERMSSPSISRTPTILNYHLTLINTTKTQNVIINNPSSTPLSYSLELINNYESRNKRHKHPKTGDESVFHLFTILEGADRSDDLTRFILQPNEHVILTVSYQPKNPSKDEVFLVIRNNLTIIESILLCGEGVSGSLTVGNRKAGSSNIPLVLEMNEKQYKFCSDRSTTDGIREYLNLDKIVTLRNTGNVKIIIHDIFFGSAKCSGQGFSVKDCFNIEIEANEHYDLAIRYRPDYDRAEMEELLILNTNIGRLTFPIVVRIPKRVLATCFQHGPRPLWESRTSWLCVCSVPIILILIVGTAFSDARHLLKHCLARFELHSRSHDEKRNIFDLKSFIAPTEQPEIRDRVEPTSTVNPIAIKKDLPSHDHKPKTNDQKSKRSTTSINGSKDNGEIVSKAPRSPDSSTTSARIIPVSPKATMHKGRRAPMDNGSAKSNKHQNESTNVKSSSARTQKSPTADQPITTTITTTSAPTPVPSVSITSSTSAPVPVPVAPRRSLTPPSATTPSPDDDHESEPFMVARPKRAPAKAKESITNGATTKLASSDHVSTVPIRSAPSPPATLVTPKISVTSAHTEPTNTTESIDENLDESWHMVSSSRTQRKNTTSSDKRRESIDESQSTSKTNKAPSTNPVVVSKDNQDSEKESDIDWDEPKTPDHDFGRYVSQTESNPEESMNINDWSPGSPSITTELPSLLSFSAVPAADLPDHNGTKTSLITSSLVTEDVEQIPYLHHAPGPIQRPTKLNPPAAPSNSALRTVNTLQSPSTPDVLDQINHLIYENTTSTAGTVTNNPNSSTVSSPLINDLTPANLAWPFPANEWSTKLEPSWSYASLQSPTISLSSAMPNPFALLSQTSRGEPPLWSSGTVGAAAPPYSLSAPRVQRVAGWTDFSSTTPASASPGPQQMPGNPWAKYMTTHVSSTTDATAGNPPFWTLPSMSTDSVVPTMSQMQPGPSTQIWWTGLSSDENNNTDRTTDDNATTRDQSRWDFAR